MAIMKLICLNLWGGNAGAKLLDFIKSKSSDTDIFCFQENYSSDRLESLSEGMYSNIHEQVCAILTDFNFFYYPTIEGEDARKKVNFPLTHGQVTFVKKGINVLNSGEIYVYRKRNEMGPRYEGGEPDFPKNFIYTQIEKDGKSFLVLNIHGFWNKAAKTDVPQRIKQSQIILDFIKNENLPAVVAGDFNLRMETKSVAMFEQNGLVNLVKKFKVPTTRSNLYDFKWRQNDPYADYIFTTKDVSINNFRVLQDEVSDHLPLYLDFSL